MWNPLSLESIGCFANESLQKVHPQRPQDHHHFLVVVVRLGRRLSLGIGGVIQRFGQVTILNFVEIVDSFFNPEAQPNPSPLQYLGL